VCVCVCVFVIDLYCNTPENELTGEARAQPLTIDKIRDILSYRSK